MKFLLIILITVFTIPFYHLVAGEYPYQRVPLRDDIEYVEKKECFLQKYLRQMAELEAYRSSDWNYKKELLERAVKNEVNLNRIKTWNPLEDAIRNNDEAFAVYLLNHGADVNRRDSTHYNPIERIGSLSLARLAVRSGAKIGDALLWEGLQKNPQLALIYFKHGADVAAVDKLGYTGLTNVLVQSRGTIDQRIQLAGYLIALGIPLDVRVTAGGYQGCDYTQILEKNSSSLSDTDRKKMREAINGAIEKNVDARKNVHNAIVRFIPSQGPMTIIIDYCGHSIPDDVLSQIDQVDAETTLQLNRLQQDLRAPKPKDDTSRQPMTDINDMADVEYAEASNCSVQ